MCVGSSGLVGGTNVRNKKQMWFQVLVLKTKSKVERVLKEMSSVIVSISYNECDLRSETKAV